MTRTRSDSSDLQQPAHPTGAALAATGAALEVIHRLEAAHGPLVFFQSGGCCDGSAPMCLKEDDLPAAPSDLLLGRLGNAPFYIDADQYERWRRPRFLIDVSPGAAEGFSLEGLEGVHFVTRTLPDELGQEEAGRRSA